MSDTKCRDCIFAIFGEIKDTTVQLGCEAGRLRKYANWGASMIIEGDSEKTYYVIKDRKCNMHCTQEALSQLNNIVSPLADIRKMIGLKNNLFILVEDHNTQAEIDLTIRTAIKQNLMPERVTVIVNSDTLSAPDVIGIVKEIEWETPFNWKIVEVNDRGADGEKPSLEWCVDYVLQSHGKELPTYSVFTAGSVVPADYLSSIDTALNDELDRFVALKPKGLWDGTFVFTMVHQQLNGNMPEKVGEEVILSIVDKAEWKAKQEGVGFMIRNVEDVCPSIVT